MARFEDVEVLHSRHNSLALSVPSCDVRWGRHGDHIEGHNSEGKFFVALHRDWPERLGRRERCMREKHP